MPYEYWCAQCASRSPHPHDRRDDADGEQAHHRATVHGGLAPAAGDGIRHVHAEERGSGCLPSGSFLFFAFIVFAMVSSCWPH